PQPLAPRSGITLIEVLISMFVLLFGLMGVAAIFPVASHYVLEGDKRDRSSGLAQIAFEELKARKILRPKDWAIPYAPTFAVPFIQLGQFTLSANQGHAFVLDPLGVAAANRITSPALVGYDYFALNASNGQNPWRTSPTPLKALSGTNWPIRRLTIDINSHPTNATMMDGQTAETSFRLRDDLAVEQPDAGDRPSVQRWSVGTGNQLLARQYTGDYSWLATVVPTNKNALLGLASNNNIKDEQYEVTTVVFYKRDIVPSASTVGSPGSERLIDAEFINGSELAIYDNVANNPDAVDLALDGIKPTFWIAVMGVNQITGAPNDGTFMMKWYKIQAMDDENTQIVTNGSTPANGQNGRYMMVQGPDWPPSSYTNLRVAILPGAIDAYTRVMQVDVE
ncbi:MAG: hypothetical protein SH868_09035, partial [Bythopirellula sp.]|nr:hypothetical protein [Bythopirellula sp.]